MVAGKLPSLFQALYEALKAGKQLDLFSFDPVAHQVETGATVLPSGPAPHLPAQARGLVLEEVSLEHGGQAKRWVRPRAPAPKRDNPTPSLFDQPAPASAIQPAPEVEALPAAPIEEPSAGPRHAATLVQKRSTGRKNVPIYSVVPSATLDDAEKVRLGALAEERSGWVGTYPETGHGFHFKDEDLARAFALEHFDATVDAPAPTPAPQAVEPIEAAPPSPPAAAPAAPEPAATFLPSDVPWGTTRATPPGYPGEPATRLHVSSFAGVDYAVHQRAGQWELWERKAGAQWRENHSGPFSSLKGAKDRVQYDLDSERREAAEKADLADWVKQAGPDGRQLRKPDGTTATVGYFTSADLDGLGLSHTSRMELEGSWKGGGGIASAWILGEDGYKQPIPIARLRRLWRDKGAEWVQPEAAAPTPASDVAPDASASDPTHGGRLVAVKIVGSDGVERTYYVLPGMRESVDVAELVRTMGSDARRYVGTELRRQLAEVADQELRAGNTSLADDLLLQATNADAVANIARHLVDEFKREMDDGYASASYRPPLAGEAKRKRERQPWIIRNGIEILENERAARGAGQDAINSAFAAAAAAWDNPPPPTGTGTPPIPLTPATPAQIAEIVPDIKPAPEPTPPPAFVPKAARGALGLSDAASKLLDDAFGALVASEKVQQQAKANDLDHFRLTFSDHLNDALIDILNKDEEAARVGSTVPKAFNEVYANIDAVAKKVSADVHAYLRSPGDVAQAGSPTGHSRVEAFGVKATKGERKKANDRALALVRQAATEGRELTEDEARDVARFSGSGGVGASLNQFFTRPDLAGALWGLLQRHGLPANARVLEPACGSGVFIETAPAGTQMTGVEIDPEVAAVAGALHGDRHEIVNQSFERFTVERFGLIKPFDAVVTNAPFVTRDQGTSRIHKPELASADCYFIDTALDHVAPGGLVAMIVHSGVMSSSSHRSFREGLAQRAELLDAFRLPDSAFAHAHTSVVADVLVFRKRDPRLAAVLRDPDAAAQLAAAPPDGFVDGKYFDTRPDQVLGTLAGNWRGGTTVEGDAETMAATILERGGKPSEPLTFEAAAAAGGRAGDVAAQTPLPGKDRPFKRGDTRVVEGVTYVLTGDPMRWHRIQDVEDVRELLQSGDEALKQAGQIANDLKLLREAVAAGNINAHQIRRRVKLAVQQWVSDHGIPGRHAELAKLAERDANVLHLTAAVQEDGGLADILTTDPPPPMTFDRGDLKGISSYLFSANPGEPVTPSMVAALYDGPASEAAAHLAEHPDLLEVRPGGYIHREDYLSGDLFDLRDVEEQRLAGATGPARAAAEHRIGLINDRIKERWHSLDDVNLSLGDGWIPASYIQEWLGTPEGRIAFFGKSRAGELGGDVKDVTVAFKDGMFVMSWTGFRPVHLGGQQRRFTIRGSGDLGEKDYLFPLDQMNGMPIRVQSVDGVIAAAYDHFAEWVRSTPGVRDRIEEHYNRTFFARAERRYSMQPLDLPGMAGPTPHGYQNEGVRWASDNQCGIVGFDVGLGKTKTAGLLARKLRMDGTARKIGVVVPKSLARNWYAEMTSLFPGSRILVIGETFGVGKKKGTSDDPQTIGRKMADAAANDYDLVIVTREALARMPVRPETQEYYEKSDFNNVKARQLDAVDKRSREETRKKASDKLRAQYDGDLAKLQFDHEKAPLYFEDVGFDALMIDEAHGYKGLHTVPTWGGKKMAFLGSTNNSKRALDLAMKAMQIRQVAAAAQVRPGMGEGGSIPRDKVKERGMYFLTATPAPNSPLDIYNMISFIAPGEFQKRGVRNAEDFIKRYCRTEIRQVLDPKDGQLKDVAAVVGFHDLDELHDILAQYTRIRSAKDVGLKQPEADPRQHLIDMTRAQRSAYTDLRDIAKEIAEDEDRPKEERSAAVLRMMGRMQQVSMDMSLVDPSDPDFGHLHDPDGWKNSPKYQALVGSVTSGLAAEPDGGHVVFSNYNGTHERLKHLLVQAGVPEHQIAIINGETAEDSSTRYEISEAFNRGHHKVVITNTKICGEGVNLQGRTRHMHHLDTEWTPGAMQQRNGRAIRQGNPHDEVQVHSYLAKGSFDAYKHATVEGKRSWLDKLLAGDREFSNEEADEGRLSGAELMIALAEDPEAARAEYEANRAARMAELAESHTAKAIQKFHAHVALRERYHKLNSTAGPKGATFQQVRERVVREALHLMQSPDLPKSLRALVTPAHERMPAMIHPETGQLLHVGQVLDLGRRSNGLPVVITALDPANNAVSVRAYGGGNGDVKKIDSYVLKGANSIPNPEPEIDVAIKGYAENAHAGFRWFQNLATDDINKHADRIREAMEDNLGPYGSSRVVYRGADGELAVGAYRKSKGRIVLPHIASDREAIIERAAAETNFYNTPWTDAAEFYGLREEVRAAKLREMRAADDRRRETGR